ncbi:transposable element Tcb2 transposase [Trichonephila clavipes]|uniref:Transposable element Tcb2 transposase n=3 Tax=Trichonephila clavipes TaxID=2585209 RepID=A0A8X6S3B1_TRICX|nr:transposable element Tcb2 transposase [Trichonephila clavipes]
MALNGWGSLVVRVTDLWLACHEFQSNITKDSTSRGRCTSSMLKRPSVGVEVRRDVTSDDFMRGRIIGKIEEGRKITDVAREFDIAHSVVSRLWKSFKTTGMCSRRHGGGRVRSTMPVEDRYIVLSAKRNRRTTAQQVANQFLAASGKRISRKTVARRLKGGGLYSRRPVVCVPFTRQHRTARLQWCREHHNCTEQDCSCVLFSDESRFSLSSDCRRQLIWRESGSAYRPENIQEKDRYPTCSNMVRAGIMINGRMRLHVVANGTMTGQRYIDEVLLHHDLLFRGAVGDKFVFMDDNATCHRTIAVQDCLDSEGIQRLVWSACSLDLNPIENVWDALERQVAGRNYPPTNKNTLIRALTEEWDKLPQQLLDNVVQIDTGSQVTLMKESVWNQLGSPSLINSGNILTGFGLSKTHVIGSFNSTVSIDNQDFPVKINVVPNHSMNFDIIIGCNLIKQANLTITPDSVMFSKLQNEVSDASPQPFVFAITDDIPKFDIGPEIPKQTRNDVEALLVCYRPNKIKTTDIELSITVTDDKPIYHSPRRLPFTERDIVDKQIDEWIQNGVIEPCSSAYASQVLVVRKKTAVHESALIFEN